MNATADEIILESNKNKKILNEKLQIASNLRCLIDHRGYYALMKSGEIKSYFSTEEDACKAAKLAFTDGLFSVHEIRF